MQNRIEAFQGLRGWAIFLVFLSHCERLYNVDGINKLKALGGAGVSLFIIMSGFLIARKFLYSELKAPSALILYKNRWKQFYKLHFITLLAAVPFSLAVLRTETVTWLFSLFPNAALLHAFFPVSKIYFSFNAVSWFLSIIMFFSVLTPLAIKIWRSLDIKKSLFFIISINFLEFVFCYISIGLPYAHWLVYINPFVRYLDFLIGGCLFLGFDSFITTVTKHYKHNNVLPFSVLFLLTVIVFSIFFPNDLRFATAVWTLPSCLILLTLLSFNGGVKNTIFL